MERRRKTSRWGWRIAGTLTLCGLTLGSVGVLAQSRSRQEAWDALRFTRQVIAQELSVLAPQEELSRSAWLVLSEVPTLLAVQETVLEYWNYSQDPAAQDESEEQETPFLVSPNREQTLSENGVPAKTIVPSGGSGYLQVGRSYIANGTEAELDAAALGRSDALAQQPTEEPLVLLLHTHGSEAYTMPEGEEYAESSYCRTLDESYNVVRVGEEIARVLEERGIVVLHDTTLHDYPQYSGAYDRSLLTAQSYLEEYPSIRYVLDIHRDAIEDANGTAYKVVTQEDPHVAQLSFVVGSDGSGLAHPQWRENLRLAVALQNVLLERSPTLMRPITLRNSRYNQHLSTGSLLVEVGTAGNSLDEALLAAQTFAEGFADWLVLDK